MATKVVLAVLLMHTWMEVVLAAEVPSKFLGLWEGKGVGDNGVPFDVTAGIIGGSTDSTVAFMHFISSKSVCFHKIGLTTVAGKNNKKKGKKNPADDDDVFEGETTSANSSKCYFGDFQFKSSGADQIIVDLTLRSQDTGETSDVWLFVLKRVDDGRITEAMSREEKKPTLSPAEKLRSRLECDSTAKNKKRGL